MNPRWLLRAKRIAQNPPSASRFYLFVAVIAVCLGLFLYERFVGVPAWMQVEQARPGQF